MILYKDNPNLKLTVVITVRGDNEYRRNCKYIAGKYYLMDRDCFFVDGKWCRYDGGNIIFDYENKTWLPKTSMPELLRGIVGFENNDPILGYFSRNPYNNVLCNVKKHGKQVALNAEILKENGFFEDVAYCVWYNKSEIDSSTYKKRTTIRNERGFTDRGYNIEENAKDYADKVTNYANYNISISARNKMFSKFLGDLTFGGEIEISQGNFPENLQNRHGVVICRDGSIDGGPELVTIPIAGAKGVQTLDSISKELENRGEISIACSYHLHIGNVPKEKIFIVPFYILCRKIQNELFTMFPYYKTDPRGVKRKNYNQKLQKLGIHSLKDVSKEGLHAFLSDAYTRIFDFLAEGRMSLDQFNKKTREHPVNRKWDRKNRYYWSNLMNMFFTHRHTVEFRLHTPTTNSQKMINWLYMCVAIVKYAERYADEIITANEDATISMKDVLNIYAELYPKDKNARVLSDYLYNYFLTRQSEFARDLKRADNVSEWDMIKDKSYKFTYKGLDNLV